MSQEIDFLVVGATGTRSQLTRNQRGNPPDLMGEDGIFKQLKRCLNAELETQPEEERLETEAENLSKKWTMLIRDWKAALNRFVDYVLNLLNWKIMIKNS